MSSHLQDVIGDNSRNTALYSRWSTVADPRFAKGEWADHGERAEREPKRGRGPGESPCGQGPETESFLSIFIQKRGQKLSI